VSTKTEKELTGRHVLLMLLTFFGVMLVVNIYFTVAAVKTFRGEDVPRSYRQGLEYNKTITARSLQNDMGWTVRINHSDTDIILLFQDTAGRALNDLNIKAKLRHPIDTDQDRAIEFFSHGGGRYIAHQTDAISGRWSLIGNAQMETETFKFEYDLWE